MSRILVMEDDKDVNDMVVTLLHGAGFNAVGVENGTEGLQLLETGRYDLIISDIVMPQKEGLDTISTIRKKGVRVPIIAMSGGGHMDAEDYLAMAYRFGADICLKKPFNNRWFLEVVKSVLKKPHPLTPSP